MRFRVWLFVLVATILAPTLAAARPLSEAEATYAGKAAAWLDIADHSVSDLEELYSEARPAEDVWWLGLSIEFGTLISISVEANDVHAPRVFRTSHRLVEACIANLGEIGQAGMIAATVRDEHALADVMADVAAARDDVDTAIAARAEDLEAIRSDSAGDERQDDDSDSSTGSEKFTVRGTGADVSDSFRLDAGRYRVTARVEVDEYDGFAVWIYGDDDWRDLLFNELIDEPGTWTGSQVLEVPSRGSYVVEVSNTESPWRLTFEPL